ncbi:hypothetical protein GCM10022247_42050 [Allokutzneria multivorans]|uniref:Immunity protein Imm1 n=1 Tax=Allokutzneria multivorans TaxID=1142134 RepID=A0ABP7SPR3_9PSEU
MIVTAILSNEFHFAETDDEISALVDYALSGRHWGSLSKFYASDRRCSEGDENFRGRHYPSHQFGIGVSSDGERAAAHFVSFDSEGVLVQSQSAHRQDGPDILFSDESGQLFSSDAALPPTAVKQAALEYCRTAKLPTSITWQEADFY